MKTKIITLLLLFIFLTSSAFAASDKKIAQKDIIKDKKLLKDEQKEFKKEEFKYSDDSGSVLSKDDIKLQKEIRNNGLKITATTPGNGKADSHDILIAVGDITNFNGRSVRIEHYSDSGTKDAEWIQEIIEVDGFVMIPDVEFSSIIVDGATGTYTTITYDADITNFEKVVVDTFDSFSVSIPGAVDGVQMIDGNVSDLPSSPNVVAYYTFNNSSTDYSGNGNDGTDTNVTYVDGCAQFNGIDSEIIVPDSDSLDLQEHTIHVKYSSNDNSNFRTVVSKGGTFGSSTNYGVCIYNNKLYYDVHNTTSFRHVETSDIVINIETVTVVYDKTNQYIYQNGELINSAQLDDELLTNTLGLYIGSSINNIFFDGEIDTVVIYNTALTPAEVAQLYTQINGTASRTLPNGTWVAVENGEADLLIGLNGTVDSFQVVTSAETATSNVTGIGRWTDNTTLISESLIGDNYSASIEYTVSNNATNSTLLFTPSLSDNLVSISLSSNNTNASYVYANGNFSIYTGILNALESTYYNITATNYTPNITDAEQRQPVYTDGFYLIAGALVSALFISAGYVAYSAFLGKIKVSSKALKELAIATIIVVIFIMSITLMAGWVYR